jgi:hypothetical protein
VTETNAWLAARNAVLGPVERLITPSRGIEETMVTLDGDRGRVELPIAIAADRDEDARIVELRLYYDGWSLTGRHAKRPPLLQSRHRRLRVRRVRPRARRRNVRPSRP